MSRYWPSASLICVPGSELATATEKLVNHSLGPFRGRLYRSRSSQGPLDGGIRDPTFRTTRLTRGYRETGDEKRRMTSAHRNTRCLDGAAASTSTDQHSEIDVHLQRRYELVQPQSCLDDDLDAGRSLCWGMGQAKMRQTCRKLRHGPWNILLASSGPLDHGKPRAARVTSLAPGCHGAGGLFPSALEGQNRRARLGLPVREQEAWRAGRCAIPGELSTEATR